MSALDARVAAWTTAYQLLEAAQNLRIKHMVVTTTGSEFWGEDLYVSMMDEARLYARLATVDATVGFPAGSWLQDHYEARIAEQSERTAAMFEEFLDHKKDDE